MARRLTRSHGAKSGAESWLISIGLVALASLYLSQSTGGSAGESAGESASERTSSSFLPSTFAACSFGTCFASVSAFLFAIETLVFMSAFDRRASFYAVFSQKFGPAIMRNASLGFCECVRPGGKPTYVHCLSMYSFPPIVTTCIFFPFWFVTVAYTPVTAFIRLFYPEHRQGVNKGLYATVRLYFFFLRKKISPSGDPGRGPE